MIEAMAASIAISMVIWVAGATAVSPASSAFLYVPPAEPAVGEAGAGAHETPHARKGDPAARGEAWSGGGADGTAPIATPDAAARQAGRTARTGTNEADLWRVRAGETLRGALGRWGARQAVQVLFLTDRRYRVHENRAFEGSFADASRALLAALSHLPHPPVGELRSGGRTLAVLHRAQSTGEER